MSFARLGMLILCGLLSRQIVGKVCTCYLSLCSIFLLYSILFVAPGLVLPLFHFQFLYYYTCIHICVFTYSHLCNVIMTLCITVSFSPPHSLNVS